MNHLPEKDKDEKAVVLDLQGEQADICDGRWMQARYYCDDGDRVRDFLSFNSVFEVNPFEVGVSRRAERKAHRVKFQEVVEALELTRLLPQNFLSLSNGEMRRVLFARAILKNPGKLVLVSPMAGLDIAHRAMFQGVIDMLRNIDERSRDLALTLDTFDRNYPALGMNGVSKAGQLVYPFNLRSLEAGDKFLVDDSAEIAMVNGCKSEND